MLFYVVISRLEFELHKHFTEVAIISLAGVNHTEWKHSHAYLAQLERRAMEFLTTSDAMERGVYEWIL